MTSAQEQLLRLITRHAGDPEMPPPLQANLADLGFDSLRFLILVLEAEQLLGRQVADVRNIAAVRTVGDMLRLAADCPAGAGQ